MKPGNRSPLILCGCPGSGTSLFAKMLRHCGVFLGADAGPIEARKFHESDSFRQVNQDWLNELIQFPHAPKGLHQFQKIEKVSRRKAERLINKLDLDRVLDQFWGPKDRHDGPWGWKDPRNSATAWIWRIIFPRAKVIVLKRRWNGGIETEPSRSLAGKWFRESSTQEVRQYYMEPIHVPPQLCQTVYFDKLLENEVAINQLLDHLDFSSAAIHDFDQFRIKVGIEPGLPER